LGITNGAQGLRLNFADPFKAPSAMREIGYGFEQHVYMSDWTRTQGHLYQDIQLVRAVVYLALSLVIAVACFNIVSTLVMAVNEKRAEIAMLKTMGARNSLISRVFVLQGLMNGAIGIMTGTVLGVLMASYLTTVASFIEQIFGVQFLSADIYFIDFLPSVLDWHDVYLTVAIALTLCLLATLYPAHKAARIDPARALSY
jgi:lipoprotein-releasing system permease protein